MECDRDVLRTVCIFLLQILSRFCASALSAYLQEEFSLLTGSEPRLVYTLKTFLEMKHRGPLAAASCPESDGVSPAHAPSHRPRRVLRDPSSVTSLSPSREDHGPDCGLKIP